MAKLTVEDIDARMKAVQEKEDSFNSEIAELEATGRKIDIEIEDAAKKGDVNLFLAKKKERADIDDMIYVKESAIANLNHEVPFEDTLQAWESYSNQYNKSLNKKLDAYYELRQKMHDAYIDMINTQKDALITRERLARYAGMSIEPMGVTEFDRAFDMQFIPCKQGYLKLAGAPSVIQDPDALWYLADSGHVGFDLLTSNIAKTISSVLVWHRSQNPNI